MRDLRVLLGAATLAAAFFILLGLAVARHVPGPLDLWAMRWRGAATLLAIVFTRSGYTPTLVAVGALGVLGAFALRVPLVDPLALIAVQLISQWSTHLWKAAFDRQRPDAWIFRHELGLSYPSGHAATAVVFYLGWALLIWSWPIPKALRILLVVGLVLWALGVGWSRIALGAHYLTDVLGGYLYGTFWLCILLAILQFVRTRTTL
jgi:undecaprenyl-diphosphatase